MPNLSLVVQENGRLPDGIKRTLVNIFHSLAGKKIRLSIDEAKEKRSLDQNAYYWAVIVPHVRKARIDMGDSLTIDQVHEDLLEQFSPAIPCKRMDASHYTRPMRSKEMNVGQMSGYVTAIMATMAQFGYPVPPLEEMYAH